MSNSLPDDFYNQFVTVEIGRRQKLETLPKGVQDGGWDGFGVSEIEFTDQETTVHCEMELAQPHSYKGYVNDFKLMFPDGNELVPTRVDGVPVGEEFYRGGDFVDTRFDLVFPRLFTEADSAVILTGNVCHEPVSIPLKEHKGVINRRRN